MRAAPFCSPDSLKTAQSLAAQVLTRVLAGHTLDTSLVLAWKRAPDLDAQGRALVQELCYGTLRHLGQLRSTIRPMLTRPLQDARLGALLCVAMYQLQHGNAPAHVVVSNAVNATAMLGLSSAKGLVNAVLRYYLRNRDVIDTTPLGTDEARFSYPAWWIERMRAAYPDAWQEALLAGNTRPPLTLRVNRRQGTRDEVLAQYAEAGLACRPIGAEGLIVTDPRSVLELPGFAQGRVSVQDYGAQLAIPFLDLGPGMRVLDACAAPGGKTTHMLEVADCRVVALERNPKRLPRIRENLLRLGQEAVIRHADAVDLPTWWDDLPFDRVLADVPCTASGVVRRHPDGKWLRREGDIARFVVQQEALLEALWKVVRPGGLLLYTTCSVFPEENGNQIRAFLARHDDARWQDIEFPAGVRRHGEGQLLPSNGSGEDNHDGFFYALLQKHAG